MNWQRVREVLVSWLSEPQVGLALTALLLLISLSGCAFFDGPDPSPVRQQVTVHITLTEDLPADRDGQAISYGDFCLVQLRPSVYPRCIAHEVVHCFGWRHDERPNSDYCDY